MGRAFGQNGDWLACVTAGAVRAGNEQEFETSNAANSFTPALGSTDANGYQAGIGIERKVLDNLSLGLEYLHTASRTTNSTCAWAAAPHRPPVPS